jgi:hypothetical protein
MCGGTLAVHGMIEQHFPFVSTSMLASSFAALVIIAVLSCTGFVMLQVHWLLFMCDYHVDMTWLICHAPSSVPILRKYLRHTSSKVSITSLASLCDVTTCACLAPSSLG